MRMLRTSRQITSIVFVALALGTAFINAAERGRTQTYNGAWFAIKYPTDFRVTPAQHSTTTSVGYDSAFFTSPDGAVQFYVFSPQWSGTSVYCNLDARREVFVDQKTKKTTHTITTTMVHSVTVRARNGSYERSWMDTATSEGTSLVFGIRYRNAAVLAAYRPQYLAFKKSLQQFGD